MRIEQIHQSSSASRRRTSAQITWEDSDRPQQEIYFEIEGQLGDALSMETDAFVTASVMPALWHGEKRIKIEGELCPDLRDGLITTMAVISDWYQLSRPLAVLEASPRKHPVARPTDRAGFFLTGGIDSLATLRMNQLNFPTSHPGAFKDGILIFGLEIDKAEDFEHVSKWLGELAEHTGIKLVPVYTNERLLEPDWNFWIDVFEGAVLAAAGHALGGRLTSATIASSFDIPNLHRLASHPMLDPFYSSHRMRIRHDGAAYSRFEKTRILSEWDLGMQYIRVCNVTENYRTDQLNCGECEKCIRTMLTLLALGALGKTRAFPNREFTADFIKEKANLHRKNFRFWPELAAPLDRIGRTDLADAVRFVCARYRGEVGWKGAMRRFDRERLNGGVGALKRAIWTNGEASDEPGSSPRSAS
ncbi:MAG: hypothetical protein ACJ8M1_14955 [Chthoniobacterales bacterium]